MIYLLILELGSLKKIDNYNTDTYFQNLKKYHIFVGRNSNYFRHELTGSIIFPS